MAGAADDLKFCLDRNLGASILEVFRITRADPVGRITSLEELGYPAEAADEDWMISLGQAGNYAVVTRDGNILNAAVRRRAWRQSRLTLLLFDKKWGSLPLREIARRMLMWWPSLVQHTSAVQRGTAWMIDSRVPEMLPSGFRLVNAPDD
jgi:hypothetical protein